MSTSTPVLIAHDLYRFFHTAEAETLALRGVSMTPESSSVTGGVARRLSSSGQISSSESSAVITNSPAPGVVSPTNT